ncbi:hypothetical protein EJB05_23902 [Eragrostis curvula]|uniref:Dof zinc finger protein n=1 Tax=Eragrostis curvula TaxID=38414 RepID=A0A5J9VBG6_9POAL|nr:hypothetical protein EJB05_23902 [Eragrostis curvula]
MPSSFPGASPSSSASSPLSYLIPARPPALPPPPLHLMGQGQGQGYGVSGVPTSCGGAVDVVSAAAVAPPMPTAGSRPRPPPRQCPRCGSANTKFCYFNNYSRSQPRYLCKACRRHWTEGGTLRDVPVGGGRKNRRAGSKAGGAAAAKASSSSATATAMQGGVGGNADVMFPDILRQVLFQPAGTMGGYGIDLGAWQQMAAATAPPQQGTDGAGALSGTTADAANYGALQYWSGWQQDDGPGLDGAC